MNRLSMVGLALVAVLMCSNASAQGAAVSTGGGTGGYSPFVVGAYMSMGIALAAGDGVPEMWGLDEDDEKARFAGGGGAYFDLYFSEMFALQAGIGFVGKGTRGEGDISIFGQQVDYKIKYKLIYMEIPIAAKLNIHNFQATLGIAFWFALAGKTISEQGDDTTTHKWDGDDDWDRVRRVNLGPRITLGYAIPVGPVSIVPGITWMFHVINDLDEDEINDDIGPNSNRDFKARAMNIMFNVGAEFGFGG